MVCRGICVQYSCHEELRMPHLVSHRYTSRLLILRRALTEQLMWARSVWDVFSTLAITPFHPGAERRRKSWRQEVFAYVAIDPKRAASQLHTFQSGLGRNARLLAV